MVDIEQMQEKGVVSKNKQLSIRESLTKQEVQLRNALPVGISPQRFLRVVFTALHTNPRLAECTKESLIAATFKAAERGFMPNGRHGALVPYWNGKKRCFEAQFQEMYQGLIYAAKKSGDIVDIIPATIRENDDWDYELGMNPNLRHRPSLSNRGKPIAYYAIIVFADGTRSFGPGPMSQEEVDAIRVRSKASDAGPWVTDPEAMAWKTVIKRNLKYIGASPELEDVLIEDDSLELGSVSMPSHDQLTASDEGWPRYAETTDSWYDSTGQTWDPRYHSSSRSVTAKGVFRRRRDATSPPPAPEPEPATEEPVEPGEPGEGMDVVHDAILSEEPEDAS